MAGWLGDYYWWARAAHIIFVIYLMAALFMLPRFFIYHGECAPGSAEDAKWIEREDRLRRIIMNPSIIIVWLLGLALAAHLDAWSQGWFHAKLALVIGLSAYHGWLIGVFKKIRRGERPVSDRAMRMLNEVPGVAVIAIVILAVIKPF